MKFRSSFCITFVVFLLASGCSQVVYGQFGDNLGSHKADKTLDMNAQNMNNIGAAVYKSLNVADMVAGGAIGTAAATVDSYSLFTVNQTTAGQTLTVPAPTTVTPGLVIYICNTGTADFTLYGVTLSAGKTVALTHNGTAWSVMQGGAVVVKGTADGNTLRWNSANEKWEESSILKNDGTALTTSGNITQSGASALATGTGGLAINGDATVAAGKKLSLTGNGSYKTSLIAPSAGMTSSYTLTLPTVLPSAASVVYGGTDGKLFWADMTTLLSLNNFRAATAANGGIDNGAYAQTWNWNALTSGTGLSLTANALTSGSLLSLSSTSTGQTAGSELLAISTSGAATAGIETKGVNISNSNTNGTNYGLYAQTTGGTSTANYGVYAESSGASNTTNYGVYGKASGATNNYAVYADGPSYFNGALSAAGDILPTATNTRNVGSSSYVWSNVYATNFNGNATSATKIGAATVGSANQPIYLNAGTPTAITSTVGSTSTPIYLNGGVPTALTGIVGSASNPIYFSGGVPTPLTTTVGSSSRPIYLSSGVPTASTTNLGGADTPIYLSSGVPTLLTATVGSASGPIYLNAGVPTILANAGSSSRPVYLSAGAVTPLSANVGSSSAPIYLSAGVPTALTASAGSAATPIYLNAGVPTAITTSAGDVYSPIYLNAGVPTMISSLEVANGGTGITSYTVGDMLYASASTTLSKLPAAASGKVLASQGTGTAPAWANGMNMALFSTQGGASNTLSLGSYIKFEKFPYNDTGVTYNNSTALFTLVPNRCYRLRAFVHGFFSSSSGNLTFKWYLDSNGTGYGTMGCSRPGSSTLDQSVAREAVAYFVTGSSSINVGLKVTALTDVGTLKDYGNSFVEIEEFF